MEPESSRNSVPRDRAVPFYGFATLTVAAAIVVCAGPLLRFTRSAVELPPAFWLMAALAVISDARPFTPPGRRQSSAIFPSVCFTFAILMAWGLGAAVAVQAAAAVVAGVRGRHTLIRAGFNVGQYTLALAAANGVFRLAGWSPEPAFNRWSDVLVVAAAAVVWFIVTYGAVTFAVYLRFGGRWSPRFVDGLAVEALASGALLLLSPIMLAAAHATAALIPLVLVPLYAVYRMTRLTAEQDELARIDSLTGLASRKALVAEVAERVADRSRRPRVGAGMALILLDLDRFKHVNDALGHAVGDRLLIEVGRRLTTVVGPGDMVARLGGDEYAVLSGDAADVAGARALAARLTEALRAPVILDGLPLDVDASMGVALYPQHGTDVAALLRHADVAMYEAKQTGNSPAFYAPESDHHSAERLGLLADLRRALENPDCAEIAMYYQPQIDIPTGEVVGVEALLRWRHPRRGLVDPEVLIRVAEQTAVMSLLTRRVIADVVAQVGRWHAGGVSLRASLNVSVRDLHSGDIADYIVAQLAEHNAPPYLVQLEITEGALMADPHRVLATIGRLDRIGIAIALDDFGTGYSSMQHLRRLPLTEVKIDRSFVLGMATDPDDAAIVRSIIELAGALGLRVVAEGVEDDPIWRALHAAGCHVAQGWFYARPMPADDLRGWLARYRPIVPLPVASVVDSVPTTRPAPGGDTGAPTTPTVSGTPLSQ
ncbi:putative bifunctional diguanylate cyclase/phosphodiesterase [Pilimelia columellifera]|uniref:Cyclic Di-GMP phosphodiesterase RmdB n=1 Tax=Pilimelia columellifera subsp. columellifera TaxID=706583 RepID=A0ABP6ART4_9ACTN